MAKSYLANTETQFISSTLKEIKHTVFNTCNKNSEMQICYEHQSYGNVHTDLYVRKWSINDVKLQCEVVCG